jgi:hypothetical protein
MTPVFKTRERRRQREEAARGVDAKLASFREAYLPGAASAASAASGGRPAKGADGVGGAPTPAPRPKQGKAPAAEPAAPATAAGPLLIYVIELHIIDTYFILIIVFW